MVWNVNAGLPICNTFVSEIVNVYMHVELLCKCLVSVVRAMMMIPQAPWDKDSDAAIVVVAVVTGQRGNRRDHTQTSPQLDGSPMWEVICSVCNLGWS